MEIKRNRFNNCSDHDSDSVNEANSAVVNFKKKKVNVTKSRIKKIASGVTSIASTVGATADEENFANEITEDVLEALKKL